jgi:DNA polymerase-3 subunit gamma/tau
VAEVRSMLGLADRGRILDLFDLVLRGDAAGALNELSAQYADGADPMAVLRDLAEVTHWISVIKITPEAAEDPTVPPEERARGLHMAGALPMRVLTRLWQMLLKAIEEVGLAPNSMMAAEMAVIRLTHVADLPDPEQLIRRITEGGGPSSGAGTPAPTLRTAAQPVAQASQAAIRSPGPGATGAAPVLAIATEGNLALYPTFDHVVALIRDRRDMKLLLEVETNLRLVRYSPGRIEFQPAEAAPRDLAATLAQRLQLWTGARWGVSVVAAGGGQTIAESRDAALDAARAEGLRLPLVQAVLAAFPQARITAVRAPEQAAGEVALKPMTEADELPDDWDPFEE